MKFPNESDALFARDALLSGCDTMCHFLRGLLDSKGRVADEVHSIRRLGKSLRGGFALFGAEKSAGREIQAIGRLLSRPRDAVSRLKTWNKIAWDSDPQLAAAIGGLLEQETRSAARRPPPEVIDWCIQRVETASATIAETPSSKLTKRTKSGLKRLGRRVGKRFAALDKNGDETFHEARKALKAWLGATRFFPEGRIHPDKKLDALGELLGDENDIATLSLWLDDHGFTRRFAPDLWRALRSARGKHRSRIIKRAGKLALL